MYLEQAANVRRMVSSRVNFMTFKLLFYPSLDVSLNGAMLLAYADGADFLHRTFEDVRYARTGWLGDAVRALDRRDAAVVRPAAARVSSKTGADKSSGSRPTLISRTHLDVFENYHPPQLHAVGASVDAWLLAAYGTAANVPTRSTAAAGAAETRRQQTLAALVTCARHVLAEYGGANRTEANDGGASPPLARASCIVGGGGATRARPLATTVAGGAANECDREWCVVRRGRRTRID